MKITTKEAMVKTASVEMKILSISGKQMTLAVYRQLDYEAIIDWHTGKLRGIPWGRVNYFWGKCEPDHLHIVWQKGEELRRACIREPVEGVSMLRDGAAVDLEEKWAISYATLQALDLLLIAV